MRRSRCEEWRENQLARGEVGESTVVRAGYEGLLGGEGIGYLELCGGIECGCGRSGCGCGEVRWARKCEVSWARWGEEGRRESG